MTDLFFSIKKDMFWKIINLNYFSNVHIVAIKAPFYFTVLFEMNVKVVFCFKKTRK